MGSPDWSGAGFLGAQPPDLERMERDDPLLIYRHSESRYTATGRVGR